LGAQNVVEVEPNMRRKERDLIDLSIVKKKQKKDLNEHGGFLF